MTNEKFYSTSINPDFKTWITDVYNNYRFRNPTICSEKNVGRLKRAYEVITLYNRGFFRKDFPFLSQAQFGQFILKNKDLVTTVAKTRPKQFGLVGLYINKLTEYATGNIEVSDRFDDMVKKLKRFQPAQFHNFRAETFCDKSLFTRLQDMELPTINNSQITLDLDKTIGQIEPNRSCKINVYSNGKVLFMIGCTDVPFPFTYSGLDEIIEFLTEVKLNIRLYSCLDVNFPRVSKWKVTWYDLNHDEVTLSDREFAYTFEQLQLYTHKNKVDGKTYLRAEEHKNPKDETIDTMADTMANYQAEIEKEKETESNKLLEEQEQAKQKEIEKFYNKIARHIQHNEAENNE